MIKVSLTDRNKPQQVSLVSEDGKRLGTFSTLSALNMASEKSLDLVIVNSKQTPPIAKIMNYGKEKYKEDLQRKEAKKKQKLVEVKELKFRPRTDQHDLEFKTRHAREFLESGNKVKLVVRFKGRELAHMDIGHKLLNDIAASLSDISNIEQQASQEGRQISILVGPKK